MAEFLQVTIRLVERIIVDSRDTLDPTRDYLWCYKNRLRSGIM